ncbi:hypothetical protein J6590_006366 [Homalodisca vitripennis]|nr:hypothetical protein J6590_006366 [Homalodisca vitripennis]
MTSSAARSDSEQLLSVSPSVGLEAPPPLGSCTCLSVCRGAQAFLARYSTLRSTELSGERYDTDVTTIIYPREHGTHAVLVSVSQYGPQIAAGHGPINVISHFITYTYRHTKSFRVPAAFVAASPARIRETNSFLWWYLCLGAARFGFT